MAVQGVFFGLDSATITSIRTDAIAAVEAILKTGSSYSIGGRQLTRANLAELQMTILEATSALNRIAGAGTRITRVYADYSRGGRF
jgi:hypothetical protein